MNMKKLLAVALTVTAPIWMIPYAVVAAVVMFFAVAYIAVAEMYSDMCKLVGVK